MAAERRARKFASGQAARPAVPVPGAQFEAKETAQRGRLAAQFETG